VIDDLYKHMMDLIMWSVYDKITGFGTAGHPRRMGVCAKEEAAPRRTS
jgi:hypothetical protein